MLFRDGVHERPAVEKILDILQRSLGDVVHRLGREEGLVRRDDHIGEEQQPRQRVVVDDRVRPVFVEVVAFLLVDVQPRRADLLAFERFDQRFGLDKLSAAGVDDHHAAFHAGDRGLVDEVLRLVGERAVERDDVRTAVELVERDVGDACLAGENAVGVGVVGQNFHAESEQDTDDDAGDLARADHPDGLAVHIESHESLQREVAVARAPACARDLAVEREHHRHRVLRDGAGQWGTALSMACSYFGLDCKVFMVKVSYEQKPFRREVMRTYGASVTPSPSTTTEVGKKILEAHPGTTGSLGCAISEAVEVATHTDGYRYVLGSVLNQVLLHQSVIGLEAKAALEKYNVKPDIIIGCAGGGSNLGGLISPFMGEKLRGENDYQFIAVEPASCPSLTRGKFAYDFCDTGMICPLAKMYTLGSGFIPSANHAGGLRFHGMSSTLSQLYHDGLMEARAVEQTSVFAAAEQFARVEGILPAPESSHAIRVAIDEALKCKETGEEKTILFGLTGTGYFDMVAYQKYNDGEMSDYIPTDADLQQGFDGLPKVD